jgi:hypothetical protein
MEILLILRVLWRRRLLLAAAACAAIASFAALGGTRSVTQSGAIAWTRVALDTPRSQLVDSAPSGADTLTWRASLLAHLMATATSTDDLARRLGVSAQQVTVVDYGFLVPVLPSALPQAAAKSASLAVAPYTLTVVEDDVLPVISLAAEAADRASATRLADAAVAVLKSQASRGGTFASHIPTGGHGPTLQPFVVSQEAPVRVKEVTASSPPLKAIGASLFVFFVVFAGGWLLAIRSRAFRGRRHVRLA